MPLPYSVVVLPDTQYYASDFPEFFDAQTAWIVGEHATGNVAFVLHEGDIVDDDVAPQWMRAYHSLHALDGVVPYVLSAGNHDYCCAGWPSDRTTKINDYFPVSTFSGRPSFKGTFEDNRIENSAHLFDVPGGGGPLAGDLAGVRAARHGAGLGEWHRPAVRGHAGDGGDARVPLR